jgi:hypothetical protein
MDEQLPTRTLSIREAAHHFGLSETTIRRRIQSGELRAFKQQTAYGVEWRVVIPTQGGGGVSTTNGGASATGGDVFATRGGISSTTNDVALPNDGAIDDGGVSTTSRGVSTTDGGVSTAGTLSDHVGLALVEENRRLQDQALQLAGRIGWLEAQLQQANEQIKVLTDVQHTPVQSEPGPLEAELSPQLLEQRKHTPWWKKLFGT